MTGRASGLKEVLFQQLLKIHFGGSCLTRSKSGEIGRLNKKLKVQVEEFFSHYFFSILALG